MGLRVENPRVFDDRHRVIAELAKKEVSIGLRVDHVDGLYDPFRYLERLRAAIATRNTSHTSANRYLIVEKILGRDEPLPEDWPVAGTTGYDFLNAINGIFVDPDELNRLETDFRAFSGCEASYSEICYARNKQVIHQLSAGELAAFGHKLANLAAQDRFARDLLLPDIIQAFVEVTACLPVYRTYVRNFVISDRDRGYLEWTLKSARRRAARDEISGSALDFMRRILFLKLEPYAEAQRKKWLRSIMQWQQFASPVVAKGLEDTASYIHNSLISLNELGGGSLREKPPYDISAFHTLNQRRLACWPHTMNSTSTHDTKRIEDVRARIDVLSEIETVWLSRLHRWSKWNRPRRNVYSQFHEHCKTESIYERFPGAAEICCNLRSSEFDITGSIENHPAWCAGLLSRNGIVELQPG